MSPSSQVSITLCLLTNMRYFVLVALFQRVMYYQGHKRAPVLTGSGFQSKHLAINFISVLELIYFE